MYKILRNRVYIGDAVHKGKSYPVGEHEPIIDRATWDRVDEVLASNARRRGNEARARTPAPLRGLMRCTHCSSAMTPTHTRRRGRLYRYYVCLGAEGQEATLLEGAIYERSDRVAEAAAQLEQDSPDGGSWRNVRLPKEPTPE